MLALLAFSLQATYAHAFGPTDLSNPQISAPESSIPKWYDAGRAVHTHVLQWKGAPHHQHEYYDPIASIGGESALRGPLSYAYTPPGFAPADISSAYNLSAVGGAKAIAIIDAYHYPTALADFNTFAAQYGLPRETSTNQAGAANSVFQVVYQGTSAPQTNSSWNVEAALDIEWAHAIAPEAKIYLVEANSSSLSDMFAAVRKAAALPNVREVSMSWGAGEFSGEASNDSTFKASGVVYFASSGDTAAVQEYPSESPYVVAVGGTTLNMSKGQVLSESPWSSSGGGESKYEPIPSFQSSISSSVGARRGAADISAVANPNTAVAIYCKGWMEVGGTSVSCPIVAAMTNRAESFFTSSTLELNRIYGGIGSSHFRKISGLPNPKASWYYITGIGSPLGVGGL